jgi:hypothetical protein
MASIDKKAKKAAKKVPVITHEEAMDLANKASELLAVISDDLADGKVDITEIVELVEHVGALAAALIRSLKRG